MGTKLKNKILLFFAEKALFKLTVGVFIFLFISVIEKVIIRGISFKVAIFSILPSFLGELGDIDVSSILDAVTTIIALFVSITVVAVITARISAYFISIIETGGVPVSKTSKKKHTIVCGWNLQGPNIVAQLLASEQDVVILCNTETHPLLNTDKKYNKNKVEWIKGDPKNINKILDAGVKEAKNVIILSDFYKKNPDDADAEALMITLSVESFNRSVHTAVQVLNANNKKHFENAKADEIICLDSLGGKLAASSSVNAGISFVLNELLTFNKGSEFYRYDIKSGDSLIGKDYHEVASLLIKNRMLVIGFETDFTEEKKSRIEKKDEIYVRTIELSNKISKKRIIVVNPVSDYTFEEQDTVFIISENKPERFL